MEKFSEKEDKEIIDVVINAIKSKEAGAITRGLKKIGSTGKCRGYNSVQSHFYSKLKPMMVATEDAENEEMKKLFSKSLRAAYTEEHDLVIIDQIKSSPHNLKNAFEEAGKILNRTGIAIGQYWNLRLKFKEGADIGGAMSSCGYSPNVKNQAKDGLGNVKELKYNGVQAAVKLYLDFDHNDRKKFLTIIQSLGC